MKSTALFSVYGLIAAVSAISPPRQRRDVQPRDPGSPGEGTIAYFDQLIDHSNPGLGTFKQEYWYSTMYYDGPGSPIVFEAPGESTIGPDDIDLSNNTMTGLIAQNVRGASINLQHRYWGEAIPIPGNFTAKTLQYLNLNQSIEDMVYFARNVKLDFDPEGKSKYDVAPWLLTGCSYPGALSAWTNALSPDTFWAYHSSSAPVQIKASLWEYYEIIEKAIPRNCSADMSRVIAHADEIIANGTESDKITLKKSLSLPTNWTDTEVVSALSFAVTAWQGNQFYKNSSITPLCDSVENQWKGSGVPKPGPEGVGLELATKGLARFWAKQFAKGNDVADPDDTATDGWNWYLCNEPFEAWQVWEPKHPIGLVSKHLTRSDMIRRRCEEMYPDVGPYKYGLKNGRNVEQINALTGGWNHVNTTRLVWVNGEFDPWRPVSVSSESRPGGPLQSTEQAPVFVIPGAAHCNDYRTKNKFANDGARKAIDGVVGNMKKWVKEFYDQKAQKPPKGSKCRPRPRRSAAN